MWWVLKFHVIISFAGISQRQYCTYYRHVAENREMIKKEIVSFFKRKIAKEFPSFSCESRG